MKVGVLLFEIREGDGPEKVRETVGQAAEEIAHEFTIMGPRCNFIGAFANGRQQDFEICDLDSASLCSLAEKLVKDAGT